MANQERIAREKIRAEIEARQHQRTVRRNQVIFAIFSGFLILSMLISLIRW